MKAALYARFSTDKQRDASIDDQFRECERIAKSSGRWISGAADRRTCASVRCNRGRGHIEVVAQSS